MIHAHDLHLSYKDGKSRVAAVSGVSLDIEPGRFIGILGPSGSGKSSLLYLLAGLRIPESGDVSIDGRSIRGMTENERCSLRRTKLGFVFQQHFLISYLTAIENVLTAAPAFNAEHVTRARALLDDMGLGDKTHRFLHELSGGERQRVAIARAMIHAPRVIFADEPTGLLDQATGHSVMEHLRRACGNGSLVAVTHNPEILEGADLVLHMRDGKIVERRSGRPRENAEALA